MPTTTVYLFLCITAFLLAIGVIANAIQGILTTRAIRLLNRRLERLEQYYRK